MMGAIAPKKVDEEQPWARVMMPLVNTIAQSPGAEYERGRVPEMVRAGVPMQVAIPQAMAEFVAVVPVNPDRPTYAPCPICGRPAQISIGRYGWPDMAYCPECNRTHIVKQEEADATPAPKPEPAPVEEVQEAYEWWHR